jgi:hypothetical protein
VIETYRNLKGLSMLAYFHIAKSTEDIVIMIGGNDQGGVQSDHITILSKGSTFGNLSYADLAAAGRGTLFLDGEKNTAEILKPGDQRFAGSIRKPAHSLG